MVTGSGRPRDAGVQNARHKGEPFRSKKGKPGGKAVNRLTSVGYSVLSKFRDVAAALPSTKAIMNPLSNSLAGGLKSFRHFQAIKQGPAAVARRIPRSIGGRVVGQASNAMIRSILPDNIAGRYIGSRYVQPLAQKGLHKVTSAMFKRNGPKTTAKFYRAMTGAGNLKQFGDMLQGIVAMGLQVTIPRTKFSERRPGVGVVNYPTNNLAESVWLMDPVYKPDPYTAALWEIRIGGATATSTTADKAPYAMIANFGGLMFNPKNPKKPKPLPPSYFAERSLQFASRYAKIGVKGLAKFYLDEESRKKAKAAGKKIDKNSMANLVKVVSSERADALRYMWLTKDGEVWQKQFEKKTKRGKAKKRSEEHLNYKGGKNPYQSNPNWQNVQGAEVDDFMFNYFGATGKEVPEWMKGGLDLDAIEEGAKQTMLILQGERKAKVRKSVYDDKTKKYKKGEVTEVSAGALTGFEGMVPIYAPVQKLKAKGRGKARKYTAGGNRYKDDILMPPTAVINKKYNMTVGAVDLRKSSTVAFEVQVGGKTVRMNANQTIAYAQKEGAVKVIKRKGKVELEVVDFDKFVKIFGIEVVNPTAAASVGARKGKVQISSAEERRRTAGKHYVNELRKNPQYAKILEGEQTKIMSAIANDLNIKFGNMSGRKKVQTGTKTVTYQRKVKGKRKKKTVSYERPVYERRQVAYDPTTGQFKLPILQAELNNVKQEIVRLESIVTTSNKRLSELSTLGTTRTELLAQLESKNVYTGEKFLAEIRRVEGKKSYDDFLKTTDGALISKNAGDYFVTGVSVRGGSISYEGATTMYAGQTRRDISQIGRGSGADFVDETKALKKSIKVAKEDIKILRKRRDSIQGRINRRTEKLGGMGVGPGTNARNMGTSNYLLAERRAVAKATSEGIEGYTGPKLLHGGMGGVKGSENRFLTASHFKGLGGSEQAAIITRNMPTTAQSYLAYNYSGAGLTNPMTALTNTPSKNLTEVVFTFKKGTKSRDQADKLGIFNYEMSLKRTSPTGAPGATFKKVKPKVERSGNNITLAFRDPEMPTRAIYLYQSVGRKGQVKSSPKVEFGHPSGAGRTREIFKYSSTTGRRNIFETQQGAGDGIVRYSQEFMSGVANAGKTEAQNMITNAIMARAMFNKEEGETVRRVTTERAGVYSINDDGLGPNLSTRGYIIRFEER